MKDKLSPHELQLNDILNRIKIIDYKTYQVDKDAMVVYNQQPYTSHTQDFSTFGKNESFNLEQQKAQLTQHLTQTLYALFYCGISNEHNGRPFPLKKDREAFMVELSNYNYSTDEPDKNWMVYNVDPNGNAFANKNGTLRSVLPNTYVQVDPAFTPTLNQFIDFKRQKEDKNVQPVFYYVFGNTYLAPDCSMMRIYWSIEAEGSKFLIEQLTKVLNDYNIPFHFKCLNHPELYTRNDSAVLYIDKTDFHIVHLLIKPIIQSLYSYLIDKHPLFTKILDKGVSIAEDPGDGQSFGMSRVIVIANALITIFEERITGFNNRKKRLQSYLKNRGLQVKNLSVNPNSVHFSTANN